MTLLHLAAQKAVEAALRRAYSLGQTYWRLADSDSYLKNAKASTTQKQFDALVQETLATIQQQPEPVAQIDESKLPPRPAGHNGPDTDPDSPLARYGRAKPESGVLLEPMDDGYWTPWHIANELLRAALQQQEVPREPVAWMTKSGFYPSRDCIPTRDLPPLGNPVPLYASPSTPQQQEAGNEDEVVELRATVRGLNYRVRTWRDRAVAAGWTRDAAAPQPLTDEKIVEHGRYWSNRKFAEGASRFLIDFARAIERAHGIDGVPGNQISSSNSSSASFDAAAPSTPESAEKDDAGGGKEDDKWAMLVRTGHLSQEVADAARDTAAGPSRTEGEPTPPRGNDGGEHA